MGIVRKITVCAVLGVVSCAWAAITGCPNFNIDLPRDTGGPVVRGADFGFSEKDDNNAVALTRAFAHCRKVGASKLALAPGKYSCRFFSERGFRTQCATYYDEDTQFAGSRAMLESAAKTPNCLGWTYYTPWAHSRDLLERFAALADSYHPPTHLVADSGKSN